MSAETLPVESLRTTLDTSTVTVKSKVASSSIQSDQSPQNSNKDTRVKGIKGASIAFIHPDLGIGGAERLVVDAAVGLQQLDNKVTVFTSHCDRSHCFEEVANNTLHVKVYGDFLPTTIFKKFHILFAILRQFYLTLKLVSTGEIKKFDYVIIDQLSFCVPLISLFSKEECKILFYCHFPDQLLATRSGFIKQLYRLPFDLIEEWTTGLSDKIVVNSNFTKSKFHQTFKRLTTLEPGVIYPCVDITSTADEATDQEVTDFFKNNKYFLSINRFERKKNLELAIKAFAKFRKSVHATNSSKPRLIIAGGHDSRVLENVEYLTELEKLSASLKLTTFTIRGKLIIMPPATDILFLPSIRSSLKVSLIKQAELLLYTPSFEHFGIVPVESMLFKTPVLAVNNGGPIESIVNFDSSNISQATGYTEDPDFEKWAKIMVNHINSESSVKEQLGENGYNRVLDLFSREQMSLAFLKNLEDAESASKKSVVFGFLKFWKREILLVLVAVFFYIFL